MLKIKFEYRDEYSRGKWNEQECIVSSVEECKRIYGLGIDCEYRIISIKEVNKMDVRKATNKILEMIDECVLNPKDVVMMCLKWMSEDDVAAMAEANEINLDEKDDEEI